MQSDITTQHLQGTSELTLLATIRPGLVDLLDSRTHASRLRSVLATLNTLRKTSREQSLVRPFSDGTDRIRTITDLRMAIVGGDGVDDGDIESAATGALPDTAAYVPDAAAAPAGQPLTRDRKLLLSVTFDRPWEPYLRTIWSEVGSLLDLIFCNCVGYPVSFRSSLAEYGRWVRAARINTRYFYRPSGATFDDLQYLRQTERLLRAPALPTADIRLAAAKLVADDPERQAIGVANNYMAERVRMGMQAVSVLYRLTDLYRSDDDRQILIRASHELLRELIPILPGLPAPVQQRFAAQLAWFGQPVRRDLVLPPPKVAPTAATLPLVYNGVAGGKADPAQGGIVQRGIVTGYGDANHGCLLLIGLGDADTTAAAADLLTALAGMLGTEGAPEPDPGHIHVNVAFSAEGLRRLGLDEARMAALFPNDFIEGMEQRAGLLGDVRGNHPLNWSLPERNWPQPVSADPVSGEPPRVQMSTVHLVVQLRMRSDEKPGDTPATPLQRRIEALMEGRPPGIRLLSVQPMHSRTEPQHPGRTRDHFGFLDGFSQPLIGARPAGPGWSNIVGAGELLLGHVNDCGDAPSRNPLTDNGSFLVIRKLRQDVPALDAALKVASQASGVDAPTLKAKMVGRTLDGVALAGSGADDDNAFDYKADPDARLCPFEAHVRRANPRTDNNLRDQPTVPRIMRRGMSYGPRVEDAPEAERGVIFMAYNASIAEQFEVIQRWISGGNSTGVLSDHGDPLLGVPQIGETRGFRFRHGDAGVADITPDAAGVVVNVTLDAAGAKPSRPFVRLEWGAYLFVPSKPALLELAAIARAARPLPGLAPSVVARGEQLIAALRKLEDGGRPEPRLIDAWKAVLEDSQARASGDAEAVWAAIRERHGGVLRTPYGVLVASHELVLEVLADPQHRYSVGGYKPRLEASIGQMYLGLDDTGGSAYGAQSAVTNSQIMAISERQAFDAARAHAASMLARLVGQARAGAGPGDAHWEVTLDVKEISDHTLAMLCDDWFFGPAADNTHLRPGGLRWDWQDGQPPFYPGHFTAPSRYVFQPRPGPQAEADGKSFGVALKRAVIQFVEARRAPGAPQVGTLAKAMFADPRLEGGDLLARTLLGVMIGFLPTVEGNFRSILNQWLGGGVQRITLQERQPGWSLWELQNRYAGGAAADAYARACGHLKTPLLRTMQLRPVPELGWRQVIGEHTLAGVAVGVGDRIVLGNVSATQQKLTLDQTEVSPVFGGTRGGKGAPTHACPGRDIGIGVLLGMLSALLDAGPVRPTPAPLTVGLRGPLA